MSKRLVIHIDPNKKCSRCGKGDATLSGVCLACIAKAVKRGEFDHIIRRKDGKGR